MFTQEFASIWINLIEEIRYDIARSNRINTDAMCDIFNRQRSGQLRNGSFGGQASAAYAEMCRSRRTNLHSQSTRYGWVS